MPVETFRLVQLPFVPLQEVLSNFGLRELIYYASCSKKTKHNVKILKKKNDICLKITTYYEFSIAVTSRYYKPASFCKIRMDFLPQHEKKQHTIMNGKQICVEGSNDFSEYLSYLTTFWKYPEQGIVWFLEFLCDILGELSLDLEFGNEIYRERQTIFDWIYRNQNGKVRNVSILEDREFDNEPIQDEQLVQLFDNMQITGTLCIRKKPSETFRYDFKKTVGNMIIYKGKWLTLNSLLKADCGSYELYGTELTNNDLNLFIKHWLDKTLTRLNYAQIKTQEINILEILKNIDFVVQPENRTRYFRTSENDNRRKFVQGGYDIQRSDSLMATVTASFDTFQIIIWAV